MDNRIFFRDKRLGRREKGEGRREKGEGRREKRIVLADFLGFIGVIV